jgi:DNA-binding MarR family transcriptional regulator
MKPLTLRMKQVLLLLLAGRSANALCHGMAEHGGLTKVLAGLERRGLIVTADGQPAWRDAEWLLTAEGRQIAEAERDQS